MEKVLAVIVDLAQNWLLVLLDCVFLLETWFLSIRLHIFIFYIDFIK